MNYIILTASAMESNRLQETRWIPSMNLAPVSLLGKRGATLTGGHGMDLFYTDAALDALVRSASVEGREWDAWREARSTFTNVRPYEAWEWLHEASREELEERGRTNLSIMSVSSRFPAQAVSLSYLDLINFERRHCAAALKAKAADHLVRAAAGRILITEDQELGAVMIRATWTALSAADRKAPEWLINGLDNESRAGVK